MADPALPLIHADAQILVFDKPSGLLTVPAKPPGPADCLEARVRAGWPEALLVHRLDRDTSGLIVFARTRLAKNIPPLRTVSTALSTYSIGSVLST